MLKKIETETPEINKNFIFDFFVGDKAKIVRDDFLGESLREVSDNYEWDKQKKLLADLKKILNDQKYSSQIASAEFLVALAKTIPAGYQDEIKELLEKNRILDSVINKFTPESISLVYPYFDNIFFIETANQYVFFSLGYID